MDKGARGVNSLHSHTLSVRGLPSVPYILAVDSATRIDRLARHRQLSKKFYQRFGDDIANEFVDWFNAVDATYRADLRQLNETNFARFDAKLEQRIAQLRSDLEQRITELDAKVDRVAAALRETVEHGFKEQTRWMFVAWASLLIPILGLWMQG